MMDAPFALEYSEDRPQIARVRYTHDAMIELVLQNPWISQNEIAEHFGYSPSWVSTIFASDSFQARMAQRKDQLIDPQIRATVEERFKALVIQSLSILQKKLDNNPTDDLVLGAAAIGAKALGYGARTASVKVETNFIVHVPEKVKDSRTWENEYTSLPEAGAEIISSDENGAGGV